ncbi:MAG: uracil-DNA glycosylase [Prochlorothrix sp.]
MAPIAAPIQPLLQRLHQHYPKATYALNWTSPEQLLIGAILAAQTTDERVNQVTPALFRAYPTVKALAEADRPSLEALLQPTGYYRRKAATVQAVCAALVAKFQGKVPPRMEDLVTLPRVGRKTANVVLNCAFNQASGIIIDTHGIRVNQRLGLTQHQQPEAIEADLMALVPQDEWIQWGNAIILHGRHVCQAKSPQCSSCCLQDLCPQVGLAASGPAVQSSPRNIPSQQLNLLDRANLESNPVQAEDSVGMEAGADWGEVSQGLVADRGMSGDAVVAETGWGLGNWPDWIGLEAQQEYFLALQQFLQQERSQFTVFPPEDQVFRAFQLTDPDRVRVLILGQDPYHGPGQAQGLAFSVPAGLPLPPSLRNIFKELQADLGQNPPQSGDLSHWASQGVLLLNAVLTVRQGEANSHKDRGWETFTDAVIKAVSDRSPHTVFILWGSYARRKQQLINPRHTVLASAHPSPLSARHGFFGSRPFSQTNQALQAHGQDPIVW